VGLSQTVLGDAAFPDSRSKVGERNEVSPRLARR